MIVKIYWSASSNANFKGEDSFEVDFKEWEKLSNEEKEQRALEEFFEASGVEWGYEE